MDLQHVAEKGGVHGGPNALAASEIVDSMPMTIHKSCQNHTLRESGEARGPRRALSAQVTGTGCTVSRTGTRTREGEISRAWTRRLPLPHARENGGSFRWVGDRRSPQGGSRHAGAFGRTTRARARPHPGRAVGRADPRRSRRRRRSRSSARAPATTREAGDRRSSRQPTAAISAPPISTPPTAASARSSSISRARTAGASSRSWRRAPTC